MAVAFAGAVDMPELVRARSRVDAETVAPERRTPAVPITRFSYDRAAMRDARLARNRIGTPAATSERSGPVFVDVRSTRPAAPPAVAPRAVTTLPVRGAVAGRAVGEPEPIDEPAAAAGRGTDEAEHGDDRPIAVVACIAECRRAIPSTTSIFAAPRLGGRPSTIERSATTPTAVPAAPVVPDDDRRPPTDHVRARAESAAADARLRAVALAQRAARLQDRLADHVDVPAIDLRSAAVAAVPARRRRFGRA